MRRRSAEKPTISPDSCQQFNVAIDNIQPDSWTEGESRWLVYLVENIGHDWSAISTNYFNKVKTPNDLETWYVFLAQLPDLLNTARHENSGYNPQSNSAASMSDDEDGAEGSARKRARRKADQVVRKFKCPVDTCYRAYGSETALRLHMRRKHDMSLLIPKAPISMGVPPLIQTLTAAAVGLLPDGITDPLNASPESLLRAAAERSALVTRELENLEARVAGMGVPHDLPPPIVSSSTTLTPLVPKAHLSTTLPPEIPPHQARSATTLFHSGTTIPSVGFNFPNLPSRGIGGQ